MFESRSHCTVYLQVLYNELVQYTDTGAAVGDPVATFDGAAVLAPRGRFNIELYLSFLKLTGQVWICVSSAIFSPHACVHLWPCFLRVKASISFHTAFWTAQVSRSQHWAAEQLPVMHGISRLQAQDYRIQYDSIVRIFLLPKSHTPHTLVVVSLDPPIRKGQTFYPHILVQLPTEEDTSIELQITDSQLEEKNEKVCTVS